MTGTPTDAWYVWLGLAALAAGLLGTATALPTTPPPAAAGAANAVDATATAAPPASATRSLRADEVKLSPTTIQLREDGRSAAATFAFGPVTPVGDDGRLRRVLDGASPTVVFADLTAFNQAVVGARAEATPAEWRPVDGPLVVRRVAWGDRTAVVVGV